MPRQSRSRPAPRPAAPTQTRSTSSAAAPAMSNTAFRSPASTAPPVPSRAPSATTQSPSATTQGRSQPGMLSQMAATAGSVAVGSTIGHGLSNMLFGSSAPVEQAPQAEQQQTQQAPMSCDIQAKNFTKCLESADVNSCSYYLDQLKACQAAAAPY